MLINRIGISRMADLEEWLNFRVGRRVRVYFSSGGQGGIHMLAGEVSDVEGDGFLVDNTWVSKAHVAYVQDAVPPSMH